MRNEDLLQWIENYNSKSWSHPAHFFPISNTVDVGLLRLHRPGGPIEYELQTAYFIKAENKCVAVVYDMPERGPNRQDLHWVILPGRRKKGILYSALENIVFPYFSYTGRKFLYASTDSQENTNYVVRQGFVPVESGELDYFKLDLSPYAEKFNPDDRVSREADANDKDSLKKLIRKQASSIGAIRDSILSNHGRSEAVMILEDVMDCLDDLALDISFKIAGQS